jgi:hypothetical protein
MSVPPIRSDAEFEALEREMVAWQGMYPTAVSVTVC